MDLDVLERARCGSRDAWRALIAPWGVRVLRTAALITGDRARAERATANTLTTVWRDLPSLHSERPFRPWLIRALLDTLAQHDGPDDDATAEAPTGIRACLEALSPEDRTTVVLHLYDQMGATELALARGTNLGVAARDLRAALRALQGAATSAGIEPDEQKIAAMLGEMVRGAELSPWFTDELDPHLVDGDGPTVRRLVAIDPADAWSRILDASTMPQWVQATDVRVRGAGRLEPGVRVHATGRLAGRRPSRDESVIARTEDQVLAWTTRSHIRPWPSAIEFRWTLAVNAAADGSELIHSLRGVSFPPGASSRFLRAGYARVADAMPGSMHAGIEQLAQLLEAGARRAPL